MKLLVVLSFCLSANFVALGLKDYNYQIQYGEAPLNRNGKRSPGGSIIDESNIAYDVPLPYNSEAKQEVQATVDGQNMFQDYLREVIPKITKRELPPVYIRHVPSPVKQEPVVPIIPVPPPQRIARLQANDVVYNLEAPSAQSQRVVVVQDLPASAQLGGTQLRVENLPSHTKLEARIRPIVQRSPIEFYQYQIQYQPYLDDQNRQYRQLWSQYQNQIYRQ